MNYAVDWYPYSVAIDDLDGDAVPDLAVANRSGDNVTVLLNQRPARGDLNCDGSIDFFDSEPFVTALVFPEEYAATYPACDIMAADCNRDGIVDFFDLDPFVELITD